MENFRMSGANMKELKDKMNSVKDDVNGAYDILSKLISRINDEELWKGEAKDTFMVYIGLMEQYHKTFTDLNATSPIKQAVDALNAHEVRVDGFYTDFTEYNNLQKMV